MALVVAAAVLLAIAAGLLIVGGPREGRRERLDARRFEEIAFLARMLACPVQRVESPVLPETLTVDALGGYCGGIDVRPDQLVDDATGAAYAYRRLSDTAFEICADFADPRDIPGVARGSFQGPGAFDPETGCLRGRIE